MNNRSRVIYFLIFNVFVSLTIWGQKKANYNDFDNYWRKYYSERTTINSYKSHFGKQAENCIDSLRKIGVDTIGAYIESFPGYRTDNDCDMCASYPWTTYLQWENKGKVFQRKFKECCQFKEKRIETAVIIRYYVNASLKIKKETIFPVIIKIIRSKKGEITGTVTSEIDHCAYYTIFCLVKGDIVLKRFNEYQIEEKKNLFYQRNIESAINSWRNIIENQVKDDN